MDIQQLIAECRMREEKAKAQENKSDYFYHMKCRNVMAKLSDQVERMKKMLAEADQICRDMSNLRMIFGIETAEEMGRYIVRHGYRMRELMEADLAGRCIVFPCRLGDTVIVTGHGGFTKNYAGEWRVTRVNGEETVLLYMYGEFVRLSEFGKTWHVQKNEEAVLSGKKK